MRGAEVIFFLFAALCVAAALGVVLARDLRSSCLLFVASVLALGVVELLLHAPLVALSQGMLAVGALLIAMPLAPALHLRGRRWSFVRGWGYRAGVLGGVSLLLFVLIGTWTRQWMTTGAPLGKRQDFGTTRGVMEVLVEGSMVSLVLAAGLLLCAVIAAVIGMRSQAERAAP